MKIILTFLILSLAILGISAQNWKGPSVDLSHGLLMVSENNRFLVFEDGTPFFYLGCTAWELFHRLSKEDAEKYLENRRSNGYTVIQAVVLAELDGLNDPNAEGETPLVNNDPAQPNEKYFTHVDWVVKKAYEKGMFVGMLPTWGDKWNKKWGVGPEIFTPENAYIFGKFLGERYKEQANIMWILGGDRPVETDMHRQIIEQMAKGIREGDGGAHLMSYHPRGGSGSSDFFPDAEWLDFHMRQNGHSISYTERYFKTYEDYKLQPVKPVIDAEPVYEDHPINFNPDKNGHTVSADIRRPLYWDLFSGAFGHTYGHHSVWQMWSPDKEPVNRPLMPWFEAIHQPGCEQMVYGRLLMESRPFLSRVPDSTIIVADRFPTSVPGAGVYKFVATRDTDGTYAMIYAPIGRKFSVRMDVIKGKEIVAWWFNPRTGESEKAGTFSNTGEQEFISPNPGEVLDWILVLDDGAKNYPPPGSKK